MTVEAMSVAVIGICGSVYLSVLSAGFEIYAMDRVVSCRLSLSGNGFAP